MKMKYKCGLYFCLSSSRGWDGGKVKIIMKFIVSTIYPHRQSLLLTLERFSSEHQLASFCLHLKSYGYDEYGSLIPSDS